MSTAIYGSKDIKMIRHQAKKMEHIAKKNKAHSISKLTKTCCFIDKLMYHGSSKIEGGVWAIIF